MTVALDGQVPPVLSEALSQHSRSRQEALVNHLMAGTSADYLAGWFRRAGTPVSATTIKQWRRSRA